MRPGAQVPPLEDGAQGVKAPVFSPNTEEAEVGGFLATVVYVAIPRPIRASY